MALLTAYQISGQTVGTVLTTWAVSDLNGNPPFKTENSVTTGFVDISSIDNWFNFGLAAKNSFGSYIDYKYMRNEIKLLLDTTTFSALTTNQKVIVSKLFLVEVADRNAVLTEPQQIGLGQLHHKASIDARSLRISKAITECKQRLTKAQTIQIANDVAGTTSLLFNYINFGLEGSVEGDGGDYLFDYILSRTGTSYQTTGFKNYSYVPIGYTNMSAFGDYLMTVLKDGLY